MSLPIRVIKLRAGYYTTNMKNGCGGTIKIEHVDYGDFAWAAYCLGCQLRDPNGWPTLREAAEHAAEYFGPRRTEGG